MHPAEENAQDLPALHLLKAAGREGSGWTFHLTHTVMGQGKRLELSVSALHAQGPRFDPRHHQVK